MRGEGGVRGRQSHDYGMDIARRLEVRESLRVKRGVEEGFELVLKDATTFVLTTRLSDTGLLS